MAKRKVLSLRKRPCQIGSSINTRTEKHGDEDVPACDIPLSGIMLEKAELIALLGDDGAYDALFCEPGDGGAHEPRLKQIKSIALKHKFEDCSAVIVLGLDNDIEVNLDNAKFAGIKIDPQVGGLTALKLQVQCTPPVEQMAKLISFMSSDAVVKLAFGKKSESKADKQGELGLGAASATNGEDDEDEARRSAAH